MIDFLVDLAALIESTIVVEKVAVTPAEPASTDLCSAAYVWGDRLFHSPQSNLEAGDDATCFYRRAYEIHYRIDQCVPVRERELPTDELNAISTVFYDNLDAVFCAILSAASANSLFEGLESCEDITVGALVVLPQVGDRISAEGSVRVTYPCQIGS